MRKLQALLGLIAQSPAWSCAMFPGQLIVHPTDSTQRIGVAEIQKLEALLQGFQPINPRYYYGAWYDGTWQLRFSLVEEIGFRRVTTTSETYHRESGTVTTHVTELEESLVANKTIIILSRLPHDQSLDNRSWLELDPLGLNWMRFFDPLDPKSWRTKSNEEANR